MSSTSLTSVPHRVAKRYPKVEVMLLDATGLAEGPMTGRRGYVSLAK